MEPLRIGDLTIPLEHPHILYAQGISSTYQDIPQECWALDLAYLGYSMKGPHKPPGRVPIESYALYGMRVYDHLTSLGMAHADITRTADMHMSEGFRRLGTPVLEQEVEDAGKPSTQTEDSSNSVCDSPNGTAETL